MNLVAADVRLWLNSAFALCTPHLKSEPPHVGCYGSWSQCPANFLFPLKQRTIRWRRAFPAGGWSAWLSQQNTFMAKSMMRAVGVLPGKREVRLIEHEAPKISATNQVKIRSLEVGVCGTDREICTFVYGSPPNGFDYLVLGHESLTVAEKGLAQVRKVQQRLPWVAPNTRADQIGKGKTAVVLGAGPVGILGAMVLMVNGFKTCVYSRSKAPNPKSELVESIGAKYISCEVESVDQLAERIGNIDLVYEAVGTAKISYDVLRVLGLNGVYVFTGIPAPRPPVPVDADLIMRNLVLKNQVVVGTVNADREAFEGAIRD